MDRDVLKQIIADQQAYERPKDYISREKLTEVQRHLDDPSILILSGLRRSGKSTLQRVVQQDFLKSECYFNFDDERLINFTVNDFQTLMEVFAELYGAQAVFYFDEIQNIFGWERFVRRLSESGAKILITGSNAKLLSRELGTHLTGRYIQFEVYPLSFKEVVGYELPELIDKKVYSSVEKGRLKRLFTDYLHYGGIPDYYRLRKEEYLNDLYRGILYRDIIARYNLSNEKSLRELVYYFASNIGKEFSYTKLAQAIGLGSPNTVKNYCLYLEQCYLFFFLPRFDHSLKKQVQYNKKCYMVDPALVRKVGFRSSEDKGRILENTVLVELKRRGVDAYFHKGKKECDFILRKNSQITHAIQVTAHLSTPEVKEREVEGLVEAMLTYQLKEGLILTESDEGKMTNQGLKIRILPIWKWLLGYE